MTQGKADLTAHAAALATNTNPPAPTAPCAGDDGGEHVTPNRRGIGRNRHRHGVRTEADAPPP